MNPDELLTHADFIRRVSRSLVLDEHRAADVAQDTWVAALEHPPGRGIPIRAWLWKVARNFSRKSHRAETRRQKREQAVRIPEGVPSTDEIVAREEARRHMVDAVCTLDEPYRSTILLRFYENLPLREVARRFDAPLPTVKTRLRRGLEKLRLRLDAFHDGKRKAWCLALAPFAGLKLAASTASAAPALFTGVWAMATKVKVGIGIGILIAASIALWQLLPEEPHETGSPPVSTGEEPRLMNQTGDADASTESAATLEPSNPEAARDDQRVPVAPTGLFLEGTVLAKKTGALVKAFNLRLTRKQTDLSWATVIHESVQNDEGRFSYNLEQEGLYSVMIRTSRHRYHRVQDLHLSRDGKPVNLVIRLDSGLSVSGKVVELDSGRPVAGALVSATDIPGTGYDPTWRLQGFEEHEVHSFSDEQGRFVLNGLKGREQMVAAMHPDYAEGFADATPGQPEEVEIRLQQGFRISGTALSDSGVPVEGLVIKLWGRKSPVVRAVLTGPNGAFRTDQILPGLVHLSASVPWPAKAEDFDFTRERKDLEIKDQDLEVHFGPNPDHITWQGSLHDYDGRLVAGATVHLSQSYQGRPSGSLGRSFSLVTGDNGCFTGKKVLPGSYEAYVVFPRYTCKVDLEPITLDRPGLIERDLHITGAVINGMVIDESTGDPIEVEQANVLAIRAYPKMISYLSRIDDEGRFCLRGLLPGSYSISTTIPGYPSAHVSDISVEEEQVINNLYIEVQPGGKLHLKLSGFVQPELRNFELALAASGSSTSPHPGYMVRDDGTYEKVFTCKPGDYTARLFFKARGTIERPFRIARGETTELLIKAEEMPRDEKLITVDVHLTDPDGSPIAGAWFHFFGADVDGLDPFHKGVTGRTDSEGRFTAGGFKPGRWMVSARLAEGGELEFPDVNIPEEASSPVTLDLVVRGGTVTGTLLDGPTGRPLKEGGYLWWIYLHDAETDKKIRDTRSAQTGNRFEVVDVPRGDYILWVVALGYKKYKSQPFYLGEGRTLDVGKILLEPAGILELEMVDEDGKPIDIPMIYNFTVLANGEVVDYYRRKMLAPGKCGCYSLPLGEVKITVKKEGYKDKKITVHLEPGRPVQARAVLEKEQ